MNMNESIIGVTLTKVCNIKPFKGATESKQVTLAVKYDGLTINDILAKALRTDVISWQNGPGRKGYDTLVDKSTINVNASRPGVTAIDPETAMVAKLVTMTPDEQKAELQRLQDLVTKVTRPTMTVKKVETE